MKLEIIKPNIALNKAYVKQSLNRDDIELFKKNLIRLFARVNESESEEHNKNIVSDFLKDTYYKTDYEINTAGRKDLVIHLGKTSSEPVAVIIEAKRPDDKTGMISIEKANTKSIHELIHYYLHERYVKNNKEIRNLIITDIYQWYIFDASEFERICNVATRHALSLRTQYMDWHDGVLPSKNTDWFYQEIAKPFIDNEIQQISCTYFNLREYETIIKNENKNDDVKLIQLYKLLSPQHLLKQRHINDSNELNKDFYNELLYIIGLIEIKEGNKKIITRKKENERHEGFIIENAINYRAKRNVFVNESIQTPTNDVTNPENFFSIFLELTITWINRILFLKLLEGQLIKYKGDEKYAFLNSKFITSYDELGELFFEVLAIPYSERSKSVIEKYGDLPYLNSSLFELTPLEIEQFSINALKSRLEIPIYGSTVLKDSSGKKLYGNKKTLEYLFEFLDSYNFASENTASIQEQNKTIINASVLGLIFEKINGYKDGSFFTPGYITMYMCSSAIRRTVLNKFNEFYQFVCPDFDSLTNYLTDVSKLKEYNQIVNSIRLCDPAVGSGHFLVSALNELIAIKSELEILCDSRGKRLKFYKVSVENDELNITDEDGFTFEYDFRNEEKQRIQETLFYEKQTIIENCLFGVDINPKSVHICRLRLWIELLKNAFFTKESNYTELETLPNIDINIKCGNSLISRFALNGAEFKNGQLKQMQIATQKYKDQVIIYKSTQEKKVKKSAEKEITKLKLEFAKIVNPKDKDYIELQRIESELASQTIHFSREDVENWKIKTNELTAKKIELQNHYEEKLNSIYNNSFEWRFEFPEILDEKGNFVGFDIIIGNPPYGVAFSNIEKEYYRKAYTNIHVRTPESFNYFWGLTFSISNPKGLCNLIIPSSFLSQTEFEKTRKHILHNYTTFSITNLGDNVFPDVATPTCIVGYSKIKQNTQTWYNDITAFKRTDFIKHINSEGYFIDNKSFESNESFSFIHKPYKSIIEKCYKYPTLKEIAEEVATGISSGLDKAYVFTKQNIVEKKLEKKLLKNLIIGGEINRYYLKPESTKQLIYITDEFEISKFPQIEKELNIYKSELLKRREAANGKIKWYSLNWPRRQKLFEEPKILIRQTANMIIAAFDEMKWYCLKSGIIIQLPPNSKISYHYLLGLLNSKLMDYLYHDLVPEKNRIFPEVKPIQLFKLPICIPESKKQFEIEKKVLKIIELKNKDCNSDCTQIEKQIDEQIFKIYKLTKEEIEIINV